MQGLKRLLFLGGVSAGGRPQTPATPDGYSSYVPDPNTPPGQCAPNYQLCGHVDWVNSSQWAYTPCCEGYDCVGSSTQWSCTLSTSGGQSTPPVDSRGNPAAPSGYASYQIEETGVALWGGCGHPDWSNPQIWRYSTCATSDMECNGDSDPSWWSCITYTTPMTPEDSSLLCSCCSNQCATSNGYVCYDDMTPQTCASYGSTFEYCDSSAYNPQLCEEVKKNDTLNWWQGTMTPGSQQWPVKVFAPYMDGGLYPIQQLANVAQASGVNHFGLAFVVARNLGTPECAPTIAGVIDIRTGPTSWNETKQGNDYFYDEVNKLRAIGGDIFLSFGGAMNIELADVPQCAPNGNVAPLVEAYSLAIDTTKVTHIDFDIEGGAIGSNNKATGWTYRFQAVKQLKQKYPYLKISFTLPILPTGLTEDGLAFINLMFQTETPWDIFNVMTMDYGEETVCPMTGSNPMSKCEVQAIDSLATQMFTAAQTHGKAASLGWTSPQSVYPRLGSTPMIGMNDIQYELYYKSDAQASLAQWQGAKPISFLSMWSITRDHPCNLANVDPSCSSAANGVPFENTDYEFSKIFVGFGGSSSASSPSSGGRRPAPVVRSSSSSHGSGARSAVPSLHSGVRPPRRAPTTSAPRRARK